jgi:Ribbon-helix-helix protein, copG family
MSRPLQVYLDEAELERLEAWARNRGWTKSQAIRAAVRALTRPSGEDALLAASGMIDGLPPDCSQQFDRYLTETFVAEKPAPYRARRRRARSVVRR